MYNECIKEREAVDMNTDKIYAEQLANEYAPRNIDLLHMTYAQQSIIGSGGYMPEDVKDVQDIMSCGKWDIESIISHEFPLDRLEKAIRTAADTEYSGNVVINMENDR